MYNLKHRRNEELHLYEFYLIVPGGNPTTITPISFCGAISGGSGYQGLLNNDAAGCIANVQEIFSPDWPYKPTI